MPHIRSFRSILYRPDLDLTRLSAPPYDVIPPDERDRLENSDPHNIVRITLGAEQPGDGDVANRYTRAAVLLADWLESGVLVKDEDPHLYLYRFDFSSGGRSRASAGIVGLLELEELGSGEIFGHEKTRPGPKADRLALLRATEANLEPLWFFAAGAVDGYAELVEELDGQPALADVTDPQGVRHRTWRLPAEAERTMLAALNRTPLVVADGHHRYETAVTYRNERRAADGPGPWDQTLVLISDPVQMAPELLPIHRLVDDLDPSGLPGAQPFAGGFAELMQAVQAAGPGTIGVIRGERCWTLKSSGEVDTVWLAETVLAPSGGEITYEHDEDIVAKAAARGATAFLMAPVPVPLVAEKALAGVRLPPKTTLFWPKPRTGLLMRDFGPDR